MPHGPWPPIQRPVSGGHLEPRRSGCPRKLPHRHGRALRKRWDDAFVVGPSQLRHQRPLRPPPLRHEAHRSRGNRSGSFLEVIIWYYMWFSSFCFRDSIILLGISTGFPHVFSVSSVSHVLSQAWLLQHDTLDINLQRSDGTSALMCLSGMDSLTIEVGDWSSLWVLKFRIGCFCMFFVAPKDGFTMIYHDLPWFTTYPTRTILAVHQQSKVRKKLWSWNRLLQDKSRCWRCFCNDLTWRWLCGQNWELKFITVGWSISTDHSLFVQKFRFVPRPIVVSYSNLTLW